MTMQPMPAIQEALDAGADLLRRRFGASVSTYAKGERDFALETDIEVERLTSRILISALPGVPVLGEELSPETVDTSFAGRFWTVDPIDGTVNFARQLPEFGTAIALIEDSRPIAAGICFPLLGELYLAELHSGAWLNGAPIHVSGVDRLEDAVAGYGDFAVGAGRETRNADRYRMIRALGDAVLRVRMPGTAALQLVRVAAGRYDISMTLGNKAWDVQAGVLLVREAGGLVFDGDGTPHTTRSRYTLASNALLRDEVLKLMSARS
ncbi:MAG: inositol monophosphatase family protein [Capsulimonadaceae bacterium]